MQFFNCFTEGILLVPRTIYQVQVLRQNARSLLVQFPGAISHHCAFRPPKVLALHALLTRLHRAMALCSELRFSNHSSLG